MDGKKKKMKLKYQKKITESNEQWHIIYQYGLHYNEVTYNLFRGRDRNSWINSDSGMNIFNPQHQQFKYLLRLIDYKSRSFTLPSVM